MVLVEALVEIDLQQDVVLGRRVDHLLTSRDRHVERLLAEDMHARVGARNDDILVERIGSHDGHAVEVLLLQHLLVVRIHAHPELGLTFGEQLLVDVSRRDEFGHAEVTELAERAKMVDTKCPNADDAYAGLCQG